MSDISHNLFLLMANLSQLKSRDRIVSLFEDGINDFLPEAKVKWEEEKPKHINFLEVCTIKITTGYIAYKNHFNSKFPEQFSLLQNAVQMLAIILERIKQNELLDSENRQLSELVEVKTKDLLEQQKEGEKSKYFIEKVLNTTPNLVYIYDLIEQRNIYSNEGLTSMLGYSPNEFLEFGSEIFAKIMHPDDIQKAVEHHNIIKKENDDKTREITYRCKHKDGSWRTFQSWDKVFLRDKNNNVKQIAGTAIDITKLIKAEEEILSVNARLNAMFENTNDYIMIADEEGFPVMWNNNYQSIIEKTYGVSPKIGVKPHALLNDVQQNIFWDTLHKRVLSGETFSHDFSIPIDGRIRFFVFSFHPIKDNDKITGFIEHSIDITESKEAEIELNETRYFRDNLIETANVIIVALSNKGEIEIFNPYAEKLTGYTKEELKGRSWFEVICPKKKYPGVWKEFNRIMKGGIPETFQNPILTKDGKEKYISWQNSELRKNGEIVGTISFGIDITEQKNTENSLRESEFKFSELFRLSPNAIALMVAETFVIINANESLSDMLGYTQDELIGKTSVDLNLWFDLEKRNKIISLLNEGGFVKSIEVSLRHRNGTKVLALVSVMNITINGEKSFIAEFTDITERKKTEMELIKAKERAEESERLKSAFLANMSHEIRTPMNGIIGFSEMFMKPDITEEKREYFAKVVIERGQHLLTIVNDILDISKIESGDIKIEEEEVNLNGVIMNAFSFFSNRSTGSINLRTDKGLNDNESFIISNRTRLNQILTNLLNNAFKFTSSGEIIFGYKLVDDLLQFYVADTGIGIAPSMHKKIFEPFRQVELEITKQAGGTGLGLSICKRLTELMGGSIWLESEKDIGSTFYFTIPYKPVNVPVKDEKTIIKETREMYTILVAEDDQINYLLIEEILSEKDILVLHTTNGVETIRTCNNHPEIDLILMDIKMPIMNGLEATKQIKKTNPELPIIAQTAYAQSNDRQKALNAGCDDYIAKPIDREELLNLLEKYSNGK